LKAFPGITDAIVVQTPGSEEELVAFYNCDQPVVHLDLRMHLRKFLPSYMEPAKLVQRDSFPVTFNNKTDRSALRNQIPVSVSPAADTSGHIMIQPELQLLWCRTLQLDEITAYDITDFDFFEQGGHSLKALYMLGEIEKTTGTRITIREFFLNPTLSFLQERLNIQ